MSARKTRPSALAFIPPCLARATPDPPRGDNWVHEIKFDGYRVQALIEAGRVRLLTRTALDWTPRFGIVAKELAALPLKSAAIDCEAIVLDADGIANFSALQAELKKGSAARIQMVAFDLLHLDGDDASKLPLLDRKAELERLIGRTGLPNGLLRYSDHMTGDGAEVLRKACAMNLEGIVSKRTDLPYRSGRNGDWTKSKCTMSDPFVVIGYVSSKTASGMVGSLVLGFHEMGEIVYAGRVGSGFTIEEARAMADGLGVIGRRTAPLNQHLTREQRAQVQWVTPRLIAQVGYRGVTADGVLRHATFEHFREDKRPEEIVRPVSFWRSGQVGSR